MLAAGGATNAAMTVPNYHSIFKCFTKAELKTDYATSNRVQPEREKYL